MEVSLQPLALLSAEGVSIWLDDLSRDRLQSGSLAELISASHVVGVTTNPSIFSSAIAGSARYQADINAMAKAGKSIPEIVTQLTTDDVRQACDLFTEIFEKSSGQDGRVSIEVDPNLAYDTKGTIARGKYLWQLVDRPNLLIKVPATLEGLPAIEELTAIGICVNVTLIFSVQRYRQVMDAYMRGLEKRAKANLSLADIHSVASFFISRIDSEVDRQLDLSHPGSALRGKAAIANARVAYEAFLEMTSTTRWSDLVSRGANAQRPLWASTGVKDKSYESTRYVVDLVAPNCVNTMPESTLNEVRAHGKVTGNTITQNIAEAKSDLISLAAAGIDLVKIVKELEDDGVAKFSKAWQELLVNLEEAAKKGEAL